MPIRAFLAGLTSSPRLEILSIIMLLAAAGADYLWHVPYVLPVAVVVGAIPTLYEGIVGAALRDRRITLDTFNSFAIIAALGTEETYSSAFIVLMLACAGILEWWTARRSNMAVATLLALQPHTAVRERDGVIEEVPTEKVHTDDILLVRNGSHVPVDAVVIGGDAMIDASSMTGESLPVRATVGDAVWGGTVAVAGQLRIRATAVGKDTTIARMAALIDQASANKARVVTIADRFAGFFLPFVLVLGGVAYAVTGDMQTTIALFLVSCADDIAVSIPLAMTAALGYAAHRGVVIKGGKWLDALSRVRCCVLDKTGTLTYGALAVHDTVIAPGTNPAAFWRAVAIAEKFSEHPVARALYDHAVTHGGHDAPDPAAFDAIKGSGVVVEDDGRRIAIGDADIVARYATDDAVGVAARLEERNRTAGGTTVAVIVDGVWQGFVTVTDTVRNDAASALTALRAAGVSRIVMFTGDQPVTAQAVGATLGVDDVRAQMTPEGKMTALADLTAHDMTMMVGDGVNDAPALARADVGVAMGVRGTSVAIETADVVILTDRMMALPEMIRLGRRTMSVVRWNIGIWVVTNMVGFVLVLTGVFGPVAAAAYNFATDFLPLANAARLFLRTKNDRMVAME